MALGLGIAYTKTELTSSTRQAELAERVYTQMVAAGIYLDAESKNRFFADAAVIVDNTTLLLNKIASENVSVAEQLMWSLSSVLSDNLDLAETTLLSFSKSATDLVNFTDSQVLAFNKSATDSVTTADVMNMVYTKEVDEVISLADTILINTQFHRQITDTLSMSESVDISLIYGAIPILGRVYLNQSLFG
jgi:hypothetical protein